MIRFFFVFFLHELHEITTRRRERFVAKRTAHPELCIADISSGLVKLWLVAIDDDNAKTGAFVDLTSTAVGGSMHRLNHNDLIVIVHVRRDSVRRTSLRDGAEYGHEYKCKHRIRSNLGSCNILFAKVQRGEEEKSEL